MGIATVVAPYEASSKEQLTLTKGQMVSIRKKTDTGWWQGEIQGVSSKNIVTRSDTCYRGNIGDLSCVRIFRQVFM